MSAGQHNSSHAYHGTRSSRAMRKLSKLGRAINLTRLEDLLKEDAMRRSYRQPVPYPIPPTEGGEDSMRMQIDEKPDKPDDQDEKPE